MSTFFINPLINNGYIQGNLDLRSWDSVVKQPNMNNSWKEDTRNFYTLKYNTKHNHILLKFTTDISFFPLHSSSFSCIILATPFTLLSTLPLHILYDRLQIVKTNSPPQRALMCAACTLRSAYTTFRCFLGLDLPSRMFPGNLKTTVHLCISLSLSGISKFLKY